MVLACEKESSFHEDDPAEDTIVHEGTVLSSAIGLISAAMGDDLHGVRAYVENRLADPHSRGAGASALNRLCRE